MMFEFLAFLRAFRPTQGIMIQKFVCGCVRPCVRAYDVTNLVPRQNLRTVIGIDLLFLIVRYKQEGVQRVKKKLKKV